MTTQLFAVVADRTTGRVCDIRKTTDQLIPAGHTFAALGKDNLFTIYLPADWKLDRLQLAMQVAVRLIGEGLTTFSVTAQVLELEAAN